VGDAFVGAKGAFSVGSAFDFDAPGGARPAGVVFSARPSPAETKPIRMICGDTPSSIKEVRADAARALGRKVCSKAETWLSPRPALPRISRFFSVLSVNSVVSVSKTVLPRRAMANRRPAKAPIPHHFGLDPESSSSF
jgi:hypothetical protein